MLSNDEKKTRKLVGMLIEVLHGDYSDTRDLAVVQLALLGQKAVPYICSYLKEEGESEKDLIEYYKMHMKWSGGPKLTAPPYPGRDYSKAELESLKMHEALTKFADNIKKKWGSEPYQDPPIQGPGEGPGVHFHLLKLRARFVNRREAIEGALRALDIIGDVRAIPTLQRLPTELGEGETPIFEKVPEIIKRIQSGI